MAFRPLTEIPLSLFENSVEFASGGTLSAYLTGTTTPTPLYADEDGTTAGTSVELDARGEPTTIKRIWVSTLVNYKLVFTSTDGLTVWTVDPVYGTVPAEETPFLQAGMGAIERTANSKMAESVSVLDFGALGDGTDATIAFQSAAATGKHVRIPFGAYTISLPVTFTNGVTGDGCNDNGAVITLTSTGQFVVGDWYCTWRGFKLKSSVNSKVFVSNPAASYFIFEDFVIEKIGSASGQIGIDFDCTDNSIYYNRIDNFVFRVDYPVRIHGAIPHVFNANRIGSGIGGNKWFEFLSAITSDATVSAVDANQFGGYFETGTNILTLDSAALRQNRFDLILDNVTRVWNSSITVTDSNAWTLLGGDFTWQGTFPTNQIFIGPHKTVIRANEVSSTGAIGSASLTTMTFSTEDYDSLNEFTPGTGAFQPKYAGYYLVVAACLTQPYTWPSGARFEMRIYKNGAVFAAGEYNASETSSAVSIPRSAGVSSVVYMTPADTLDIRLLHNRGADTTLETSPSNNHLSIIRVY